jgi:predicted ATPase with chaperone activity
VLIDRFDLRVAVGPTAPDAVTAPPSAAVRVWVAAGVARQQQRYRHAPWRRNAWVPAGALPRNMPLRADAKEALVASSLL